VLQQADDLRVYTDLRVPHLPAPCHFRLDLQKFIAAGHGAIIGTPVRHSK